MSRYLSMTDAQRAQLGQGSNSGATTTGGATTPATTPAIPAASGTGLEGRAAYRAHGYATL